MDTTNIVKMVFDAVGQIQNDVINEIGLCALKSHFEGLMDGLELSQVTSTLEDGIITVRVRP